MTAAAPTITDITFDKSFYEPGDDIHVTVRYTPGESEETVSFTGTATTAAGQTGQMNGTFTVGTPDPTAVTVADSGGRNWAKVSDDGAVAVFQAKA